MSPPEAGAAVGLRFTGDVLPGLTPDAEGDLPRVEVELTDEATLDARWARAAAPRRIFARAYADGRPYLSIDLDPELGYRVWGDAHGTHLLAADGARLASALPDAPAWRALRLLAAQTLPLLTALRGREVLHAAGVVTGERLVGVVASSGTGKSATAAHVIAQGGEFFADDVLALEIADGGVRAHPATRMLNLHRAALDGVPEADRARLGEPLGESDKVHLTPTGFRRPLPLSGLVFLERGPGAPETIVERAEGAPARLLGNAFLPYLDGPDRLANQLDVMSAIARTVPLARLRIAAGDGPDVAAAAVRDWVARLP